MRKLIMLLGFILAFCISDSNVFAEEREVSEEQLNDFILSTGAPNELLERWDYDQKLDLYLKSTDSTIIFDTTETTEFTKDSITGELIEIPSDSNVIMPMATIPSKDLKVSHDVWTLIDTDKTKYKSVYANYSWNFTKHGGTNGDKIAIAVPSGWSIKANSYKCKEFQSGLPSSGYVEKGNCNGKPYDLDFYGAVWSLTRTDYVWHKGWVSLDMKRTNTNAQLKVLSKYIEDTGSSTSWSIGWGPMSVSISGNKSNNQVAWDTAFTY